LGVPLIPDLEDAAMNKSLDLEELVFQSLDRQALKQKFRLPHPLSAFAANGAVNDGIYADVLLEFVQDWTLEPETSARHRAAAWFLLDSEQAFFRACSEAGIDAERFREHLRKCQVVNEVN
jgi:hypothetical protein